MIKGKIIESKWRKRVRLEYARLWQDRERNKFSNDAVKLAWTQNRNRMTEMLIQKASAAREVTWIYTSKELPEYKFNSRIAEAVNDEGGSELCRTVLMVAEKSIPTSYMWLTIHQNIMIHDAIDEFRLDDKIFVDLVDALMRHETVEPQVKRGRGRPPKRRLWVFRRQFLISLICRAISALFPGEGNPEELELRYSRLTKPAPYVALEPAEDMNYLNAASVLKEQMLGSFRSLFCRRCFIYDCQLHPFKDDHTGPNLQKRKRIYLKPPTEPCGAECYMSLADSNGGQAMVVEEHKSKNGEGATGKSIEESSCSKVSSNREEPSYSKGEGAVGVSKRVSTKLTNATDPSSDIAKSAGLEPPRVEGSAGPLSPTVDSSGKEWTESDKVLFRNLQRPLLDNYCAIAKIMMDKTCQQVYNFAQKEKVNLCYEASNSGATSTRKPKKRKFSTWFNKCLKMGLKKSGDAPLHTYKPCKHLEEICVKDCPCVDHNNFCEKFCLCSLECPNRFPGCRCKTQCNTEKCPCYLAVRECDPDLCKTCRADQFDVSKITCKNICIQRRLHKHVLMGRSDIAGWGCFLKDGAKKNEFIYEYCGEIISQEEADKRGKVYDQKKCSFLFNLNEEYVIDATRIGNKIRFANHSINANCYAKVVMVNGDHRIGLYAKRNISPGEELFFNYRYGTRDRLEFVALEREPITL